eukprot:4292019-Pleurochrysis_carterae.AAC.1
MHLEEAARRRLVGGVRIRPRQRSRSFRTEPSARSLAHICLHVLDVDAHGLLIGRCKPARLRFAKRVAPVHAWRCASPRSNVADFMLVRGKG